MKSKDEILKMQAIVGFILRQSGRSLDYVKLYKLLYFAHQLHLVRYGRGLVNDSFYARERGPIPGFIYTGMKYNEAHRSDNDDLSLFSSLFEIDSKKIVHLKNDPDMEELSQSDIECIDEVVSNLGHLSSEELSDLSHRDQAWIDGNSRRQIDPDDNKLTRIEIARAGGASNDMIAYLRHKIELDQLMYK